MISSLHDGKFLNIVSTLYMDNINNMFQSEVREKRHEMKCRLDNSLIQHAF